MVQKYLWKNLLWIHFRLIFGLKTTHFQGILRVWSGQNGLLWAQNGLISLVPVLHVQHQCTLECKCIGNGNEPIFCLERGELAACGIPVWWLFSLIWSVLVGPQGTRCHLTSTLVCAIMAPPRGSTPKHAWHRPILNKGGAVGGTRSVWVILGPVGQCKESPGATPFHPSHAWLKLHYVQGAEAFAAGIISVPIIVSPSAATSFVVPS